MGADVNSSGSGHSATGAATGSPPSRALGPAVARFEAQLRSELESYWLHSHRGCDVVSVLHHACIHPFGHDLHLSVTPHAISPTQAPRLTCHCGLTLLRWTQEPFEFADIRRALSWSRCCGNANNAAVVRSIGQQAFQDESGLSLQLGWNVWSYAAGYQASAGLGQLSGFFTSAARTAFLSTVLLATSSSSSSGSNSSNGPTAGSSSSSPSSRVVHLYAGLEFNCPFGHRWLCDADSSQTAHEHHHPHQPHPHSADGVAAAAPGFPRRDTFLFRPCQICRHLRHLHAKSPADVAALEARQKKSFKEEQQRQRGSGSGSGGASSGEFGEPAMPSLGSRSHDRYAQLRRIWLVTPPAHVAQVMVRPVVKSTRPPPPPPPVAKTAATTTTTVKITAMPTTATTTSASPPAASGGSSSSSSSKRASKHSSHALPPAALLLPSLFPADNFRPATQQHVHHPKQRQPSARRCVLPPSSFVSVELPLVYMRADKRTGQQCLTNMETRYCMSEHSNNSHANSAWGSARANGMSSLCVCRDCLLLLCAVWSPMPSRCSEHCVAFAV